MILSGRAKLAGVLGWPISHSRSPRLHGYWLEQYEIDGAYVPLAVAPEHFAHALRVLAQLGFAGVNVTLPHKEAALAAVDTADAQAVRIGAVNTVTVREDGSLHGANSDAIGFLAHLGESVRAWRAEAGPAVVIGAGGAARAIAVALLDAGVPEIRLVNRTMARAEALAIALGERTTVAAWFDRARVLDGAQLLVNASSLGMDGEPTLELTLDALPPAAAVYDIVYAPLQTHLLATAAARGHRTVDGLGMLLHQARMGFAAWFGVDPEVSEGLRAFVVGDLRSDGGG